MEAATQPSRAATRAVAASTRPRGANIRTPIDPGLRPGPLPLRTRDDLDAGATMVEYGLMVALVALVALLAVTAFGINVNDLIDNPALLDALA